MSYHHTRWKIIDFNDCTNCKEFNSYKELLNFLENWLEDEEDAKFIIEVTNHYD